MINGKIRVNLTNPNDFTDLKNYRCFSMHDPIRGHIPRLLLDHSNQFLFSIGHDGNVFVYEWCGPQPTSATSKPVLLMPKKVTPHDDITDPEHPSLEQEKVYAEMKRQEEKTAAHNRKILSEIGALQKEFDELLLANEAMHFDLQLSQRELFLDDRITNQIRNELQAELDDVREDLAYDLEVAQVGKQKLYEYFLKKLPHLPFKVSGIE